MRINVASDQRIKVIEGKYKVGDRLNGKIFIEIGLPWKEEINGIPTMVQYAYYKYQAPNIK